MRNTLLIIIFFAMLLMSCKSELKQRDFSLNATLSNIPDSTLFILKDASNTTLDSAYVINQQLELHTQFNDQQPKDLLLFTSQPEFIYTKLLAGNEHLSFAADKSDFPWHIDVSGSKYQDQAELFNQLEYQRQEISAALRRQYDSNQELLSEHLKRITDSIDREKINLIRENFNSHAALSRFKYHKTEFSIEELKELYDQLDDELRTTSYGKAVKLQSEFPKPEIGQSYYNYSAMNQYGDTLALSDIKEKHILLHFSSVACYGSQLSLPELKTLHDQYSDNLAIVSISSDPDRTYWENHVKRDSIPWNYLWDGKGSYSDAIVKYWEVGTPNYVLISPNKIILEQWLGFRKGIIKEKLESHLNK